MIPKTFWSISWKFKMCLLKDPFELLHYPLLYRTQFFFILWLFNLLKGDLLKKNYPMNKNHFIVVCLPQYLRSSMFLYVVYLRIGVMNLVGYFNLISLFDYISTIVDYLMPKPSLSENSIFTYLAHKGIRPKVKCNRATGVWTH